MFFSCSRLRREGLRAVSIDSDALDALDTVEADEDTAWAPLGTLTVVDVGFDVDFFIFCDILLMEQ